MDKFNIILKFLKFFFSARTKYQVHSPFVYEFVEKVLEDDRQFYAFSKVETLRKLLLQDGKTIEVQDFGAGSKTAVSSRRSIKSIAKSAVSGPFFSKILFRTVNLYKPSTILEIGTSLGISSLYQHLAAQKAKMITLEGCPEVSKIARKNFDRMEAKAIRLITGTFETSIPQALDQLQRLDYLFIDGNHRKAPTLSYFEECLKCAHPGSVFILDDIYWSSEMQEAWQIIKAHPEVSLTIDLFFMGLVFFRHEQREKEHFKLVRWWWKPWRMGFFK